MYRVFLGAPSKSDLQQDPSSYHWQTVSSTSANTIASQPPALPPATLEAASRRISLIYQNAIFHDAEDEEQYDDDGDDEVLEGQLGDQTTAITWLTSIEDITVDDREDMTHMSSALLDLSKSYETTETQSYNYSDASSIARFPTFHFSLHSLTSLASLSKSNTTTATTTKGSRKVTVLLAALEIEGPNTIGLKKGAEAGKEISILTMILGDEDGNICKLTAWREVAEAWGGSGEAIAAKRGDILLIENVTASCDATSSPTLSASPYLKSKLTICYRAMPYTHEDNRLRPDLRLGSSDPAVRRVAAVVRWFEGMVGLNAGK